MNNKLRVRDFRSDINSNKFYYSVKNLIFLNKIDNIFLIIMENDLGDLGLTLSRLEDLGSNFEEFA